MVKMGDRLIEVDTGGSFVDWAIPTLEKTLHLKPFIDHPELFDQDTHGVLTWEDIMNIPMKETDRFALITRWNVVKTKFARDPSRILREFTEACNVFRVNKLETLLAPVNNILGYTSFDNANPFSEKVRSMVGIEQFTEFVRGGAKDGGDKKVQIYRDALANGVDPKMLRMLKDRLFSLNSVLAVRRKIGKEGGSERIKKVKIGEVKMAFSLAEMLIKIVKTVDSGKKVNYETLEPYLDNILGRYNSGIKTIDDAKLHFFLGDARYRAYQAREHAYDNWAPVDEL